MRARVMRDQALPLFSGFGGTSGISDGTCSPPQVRGGTEAPLVQSKMAERQAYTM